MVESKKRISFVSLTKNQRGLVQIVLLPMLTARELLVFALLCRSCNDLVNPKSKNCVNFVVLYKAWGLDLEPQEVFETLVSTTRALSFATKWCILN